MIKILGVQTTDDFIYDRVEEWIDTCGLPNAHFIDNHTLRDLVKKCVIHDRKFCKKLRDNKLKKK